MNLTPRPCIPYSKKYGQQDPIGQKVSEPRFLSFSGPIPPDPHPVYMGPVSIFKKEWV